MIQGQNKKLLLIDDDPVSRTYKVDSGEIKSRGTIDT